MSAGTCPKCNGSGEQGKRSVPQYKDGQVAYWTTVSDPCQACAGTGRTCKQHIEDEILSRILGYIFSGVILGCLGIIKLLWRPLVFTGLWPFVILFVAGMVHPYTREWTDTLAMPIFFSLLFSIFWTIKNIVKRMRRAKI